MTVHKFSDEQVDKARHALGLDREKCAYRNFYSTGDDADWNDLVERGMAVKRKSPVSPDFLYHLTRRAAYYFMNPGERIDPDLRFPTTAGSESDDPDETEGRRLYRASADTLARAQVSMAQRKVKMGSKP